MTARQDLQDPVLFSPPTIEEEDIEAVAVLLRDDEAEAPDDRDFVLADLVNSLLNFQQFIHSDIGNQLRRNSLVDIHTDQKTVLQQKGIPFTLQVAVEYVKCLSGIVLFRVNVTECPWRNLIQVKGVSPSGSKILQHLIPGGLAKFEGEFLYKLIRSGRVRSTAEAGHNLRTSRSR